MIVAFVPNMMDRSRFGTDVRFVASADDFDRIEPGPQAGPVLVLVDLDRCADPAAFRRPGARVIGFGSHVDRDGQDRARAAGYDEVLARSVFFRRLPQLLDHGTAGSTEPLDRQPGGIGS